MVFTTCEYASMVWARKRESDHFDLSHLQEEGLTGRLGQPGASRPFADKSLDICRQRVCLQDPEFEPSSATYLRLKQHSDSRDRPPSEGS